MERFSQKIGDLWTKYGYDLFVILCIVLISFITFNLGKISALKQSPITIGQDSNLTAQIGDTGSDKAIVFKSGQTALGKADQAEINKLDKRVVASKSSSSKKYHYTWCASGKRIKAENQLWFETAAAAQAAGYTLAGNCQ